MLDLKDRSEIVLADSRITVVTNLPLRKYLIALDSNLTEPTVATVFTNDIIHNIRNDFKYRIGGEDYPYLYDRFYSRLRGTRYTKPLYMFTDGLDLSFEPGIIDKWFSLGVSYIAWVGSVDYENDPSNYYIQTVRRVGNMRKSARRIGLENLSFRYLPIGTRNRGYDYNPQNQSHFHILK